MDNEKYYDDEIAPRLAEIAALCSARDMPMVAAVYFDGECSGVTQVPPTRDNPSWTLMLGAWQAHGNIDALCIGLARKIAPENDGSIALRMFRGGRGPA